MLKTAAKALVSSGALLFIVRGVDTEMLYVSVSSVNLVLLAGAAFGLLALTPLLALRWSVITSALRLELSYRRALDVVLIGMFFNQLLPSSVGGDAYRAWAFRRSGTPLARALSSLLLDRGMALLATLLVTVAGIPVLYEIIAGGAAQAALTSVLVLSIVSLGIGLFVASLVHRLPLLEASRRTLALRFIQCAVADLWVLLGSPKALFSAVTLSVIINVAVSCAVWLIAAAMGHYLSVTDCVFVVPLVMLMSMIPISIGGWGVREGSMMVALGFLGVAPAAALAISVLYGLSMLVVALPGALMWLLSGRKQIVVAPDAN